MLAVQAPHLEAACRKPQRPRDVERVQGNRTYVALSLFPSSRLYLTRLFHSQTPRPPSERVSSRISGRPRSNLLSYLANSGSANSGFSVFLSSARLV